MEPEKRVHTFTESHHYISIACQNPVSHFLSRIIFSTLHVGVIFLGVRLLSNFTMTWLARLQRYLNPLYATVTVQWGFCIATVKYLNTVYTEREPTIGFDFTGIETAHVSHRPVMVSLISPWGLSASLSFCEPYSGGPFIPAPHLKTENQYTPQLTKSGSIYIYKLHFYHYTYSELIKGIAELSFHLFCTKKVVKIERPWAIKNRICC